LIRQLYLISRRYAAIYCIYLFTDSGERQLNTVIDLTKEKAELEKLREKQLEQHRIGEARENEQIISEFVSGEVIRAARA
jgi:hypothetical protein